MVTLAYLFTSTNPVENTFTPAKVGNHIVETNESTTKKEVKVQNSIKGKTDSEIVDAYIRATYVVNWRKTENGVKSILPATENTDYTVSINTAAGSNGKWVLHTDGYYYYTGIVAPGGVTDVFITSIAPVFGKAPAGYTLNVEIISQSIQAEGTDADGKTPAEIAWGVDPSTLS